ncbi:MAG: DUF433 domain-containing protein [Cyanobacteria bacterium P01_H01_bin.119]
MTFEQLQAELLELSAQEKAQIIQLLVSNLSSTWIGIEKTPGVMGGDACIRRTRIPVWLLVSLQQQGATEAFILEDYPDLSAADLANAWRYASAHQAEIEAAIQRQTDA